MCHVPITVGHWLEFLSYIGLQTVMQLYKLQQTFNSATLFWKHICWSSVYIWGGERATQTKRLKHCCITFSGRRNPTCTTISRWKGSVNNVENPKSKNSKTWFETKVVNSCFGYHWRWPVKLTLTLPRIHFFIMLWKYVNTILLALCAAKPPHIYR